MLRIPARTPVALRDGQGRCTRGTLKAVAERLLAAWIVVALVGVPLLIHPHFYPDRFSVRHYGELVIYGFFVWLKASRIESPDLDLTEVPA